MDGAKRLAVDVGVGLGHDKLLERAANSVLAKTGILFRDAVVQAYMPAALTTRIEQLHENIWPEIEYEIRESIFDQHALSEKTMRENRLHHWSHPLPFWPVMAHILE